MHDAKLDFKKSVIKVIVFVRYEFRFFQVLKFLTVWWSVGWLVVGAYGWWLVGWWLVVGWSVVRWSVVGGQLVGGFKETL